MILNVCFEGILIQNDFVFVLLFDVGMKECYVLDLLSFLIRFNLVHVSNICVRDFLKLFKIPQIWNKMVLDNV